MCDYCQAYLWHISIGYEYKTDSELVIVEDTDVDGDGKTITHLNETGTYTGGAMPISQGAADGDDDDDDRSVSVGMNSGLTDVTVHLVGAVKNPLTSPGVSRSHGAYLGTESASGSHRLDSEEDQHEQDTLM